MLAKQKIHLDHEMNSSRQYLKCIRWKKRVEKMKKYEKALDNLPMHVKRLQCHEYMRNNNSITQQQT
jgi:hypothetical protein